MLYRASNYGTCSFDSGKGGIKPPAENPLKMRALTREPRRPNLATIVGSGLAVVAAGSLLAFSTLAEQAGLQGLATGGLQPARPNRTEAAHPITVPAPATAPPRDPREALTELVRDTIARVDDPTVAVAAAPEPRSFTPIVEPRVKPKRIEKAKNPSRPSRTGGGARVAIAGPSTGKKAGGPPYGHAYGHHKKDDNPKPAKAVKKHRPKASSNQPVHAPGSNGKGNGHTKAPKAPKAKSPKPPKTKAPKANKVAKAASHGNGGGNGKAKGHAKHAHKGKGKGHSKHGH